MRGKKAQFYLLAAIIIITLIIGFVTVTNYSSKQPSVKIYDLKEELGIESQNVIGYGTSSGGNMNTLLGQFIETYVTYMGSNKNLYFIYGDAGDLQVKAYEELVDVSNNYQATIDGEKVVVSIEDVEYQFDLIAGQNFYFIISQEIDGGKYIVTG